MAERIRWARQEAKLSLEAVGEVLGITGSAVSQWETGKTYPSRKRLLGFADLTRVDPRWLETGAVNPEARKKQIQENTTYVPLLTPVQAVDYPDISGEAFGTLPFVRTCFECSSSDAFALDIFDRRNSPEYEIGDRIVLKRQIAPAPGDMVLAAVDAAPVFAKYLPRGHHTLLKPLNEDYGEVVLGPGYQEGHIIAVMIEHTHPRRIQDPSSTEGNEPPLSAA